MPDTIRMGLFDSMTFPVDCSRMKSYFPKDWLRNSVELGLAGRSQGLIDSMAEWRKYGLSHLKKIHRVEPYLLHLRVDIG